MTDPDDQDIDISEMKAQALLDKRRAEALYYHPDPRDPDYPGDDDDQRSDD